MPVQSGTAPPGISSAFLAANQTGVGSDAYGGTLVEAVQAGAGIEAILLAGIVAGLFHSLATVHSQPRRDSPLLLVERARFLFIILLVVATFIAAGMHRKEDTTQSQPGLWPERVCDVVLYLLQVHWMSLKSKAAFQKTP